MTDVRLIIKVVYAQFSFGSLGLFKGSWLHFCKGANLTVVKYSLNPLVLLVTCCMLKWCLSLEQKAVSRYNLFFQKTFKIIDLIKLQSIIKIRG